MNKMLEEAIAKVQNLPPDVQEHAARILLTYVGDEDPIYEVTPEELADLEEAQAEMRRGEFATDAEVQVVFAKYRL